MNEAKTTWALVVGIDRYNHQDLSCLEGAVADAAAVVQWLRKLQVPDEQIFLHAAPSETSWKTLDTLNLHWTPANKMEIWSSIYKLQNTTQGTRLFVFLSGHGLYEPSSRRLFLTQEAGINGAWNNLGMDSYLELFLSMSFGRVFVFLDGCQNYPYPPSARPLLSAQPPPVTGYNAKPGNLLVTCYAAAQGQRAAEVGQRGLFLSHLLRKLDPENVWERAVDLDFKTGARTVDLRKLFYDYVLPKVQREAASQSPPLLQTPELQAEGPWPSQAHPVIRLKDMATAPVKVTVSPGEAVPDVRWVRIFANDDDHLHWYLQKPELDDPFCPPVEGILPQGTEAIVECRIRSGAPWEIFKPEPGKSEHPIKAGEAKELLFELKPREEAPPKDFATESYAVSKETEIDRGSEKDKDEKEPRELITLRAEELQTKLNYDKVAKQLGLPRVPKNGDRIAEGVWIRLYKKGPTFSVWHSSLAAGLQTASDWRRAMAACLPESTRVSMQCSADFVPAGNLRITLPPEKTAESLAGGIASEELIWVGLPAEAPREPLWQSAHDGSASDPIRGRTLSLKSLELGGALRVEPGPIRVRLDLPWGSWTQVVRTPESGEVTVELPDSVGIPPLRVALWPLAAREEGMIVGATGERPRGWQTSGLFGKRRDPLEPVDAGEAAWALGLPHDQRGGARLVEIDLGQGSRGFFPAISGRPLAVDLSGGGLRVEPLSTVPLANWDLLMASGRLDLLDFNAAASLLGQTKEDWLLALAAGYIALFHPEEIKVTFLHKISNKLSALNDMLTQEGSSVPDLDLLCIALAARKAHRKAEGLPQEPEKRWFERYGAERLETWAKTGAVPVLRWGIQVADHLLGWAGEQESFLEWRTKLERIEENLSPISTWTAWIEEEEKL